MVQSGPLVQLGVVLLSVLGLWAGARLLVDAVVRLARRVGLSELTIGLTVVAIGTSTPELAVTVDAALKGLGDIAVSNVLGSNVYNLAFVLGTLSLVRAIPATGSLVRRDGVALLASVLVAGVVLSDLVITRLEGAALTALLGAYTAFLLRAERTDPSGTRERPTPESGNPDAGPRPAFRARDAVTMVGGLALVLVSGDALVLAASGLARGAGVSEWVIGGTVVAAGTSTPEFAVSLVAIRRGSLGVSVGNVIGSSIYNVTGIIGIAALVRPLAVSGTAFGTLAWLAVVSVAMVAALWTGRRLSRPEGALFAGSEVVRWILGLLGLIG